MCGICGEFRFDQTSPSIKTLQQMNARQTSRGPDHSGLFIQDNIGLGHTRLKIMDLSAASAQPMHDYQLGLTLVFNGAIYNYPEIRQQLEQLGYQFYSSGDTEVVLKAFHAWGPDCLQRFNGMFAFVIWLRDQNKLFMARDRLGIKPLYYSLQPNACLFASTLPALLTVPTISKQLNPKALHFYMHFHSVVPAPDTVFSHIHKLEPGHYQWLDGDGQLTKHQYWQLNYASTSKPINTDTLAEWQSQLTEQLLTAVKRRNVAAVDVGVLLSGGVDSSLLVGLLTEVKSTPIQTFSIGFDTVDDEAGDEFKYSDLIAEQFATDHHKLFVSPTQLMDNLPSAIAAMAEPMMSHDCIAFYLLAAEVSKHCKAVQSGQGADEVFGGYHWYPPLLTSNTPVQTYKQHFFDRNYSEYQQIFQTDWLTQDYASEFVAGHFSQPGANDPINKALRLDTTVMLIEDPVKRVDNMTMAHGLEARVPFLDHELVEFSATLPAAVKVKANDGKWILKSVARQFVTDKVIDRPKGYFPVPALKYLQGPTLDWVAAALTSHTAKQRKLYNQAYIDTLLSNPKNHLSPLNGSKLWQMGLLELWLQTQGI
ncbi:N-acetylglutaminylglutamine amidotransferase [Spartinivicinus poritis]|uniref:asparagine synthase (glutamine-hydrolyzing) n=1 Tax=Spartinivicinus poritis TaxID=2994640 RepID=A0ABT5U767_9GAMM|nr:N-acetylglutaminylglutamine amidotransferase [Spartinivicinus sp. A2-2]MDE1462213.1 N-acetylglutaminylglutamine amidotransferase [Spartinivicinus sp. A2-2]